MSRGFYFLGFGLILAAASCIALAQEPTPSSLLNRVEPLDSGSDLASSSTPQTSGTKAPAGGDVTEITATQGATFDQQTRQAIFLGDVHVTNPQFTLTSDKLTAILKKEALKSHPGETPAPGAAKTPASNAGKTPAPDAARNATKTPPALTSESGLEKVIAEGNVVIVQVKPAADGGAPVRYVAKAEKAVYDSATGDATLTGWPQVQQGINTQVSTEPSTVMVLNRDGRMTTTGGSKTLIQDTGTTTSTSTSTSHP